MRIPAKLLRDIRLSCMPCCRLVEVEGNGLMEMVYCSVTLVLLGPWCTQSNRSNGKQDACSYAITYMHCKPSGKPSHRQIRRFPTACVRLLVSIGCLYVTVGLDADSDLGC